jgi:Uma2 family endonuclease
MVEVGIFGPADKVELLDGEIVEMSPERSRHAAAVDLALDALRAAFGRGFTVRVQHPLALSETSELDLAVVVGSARDYVAQHPSSALLVVEVADTSLEYDRGRKAAAYARAGIQEHWILNIQEAKLEVCRDPSDAGYRSKSVLGPEASLAPLARPERVVPVADLLP